MKAWAAAAALALAADSPALGAEREMSTDRPDRTESAYTVPRGRWQVEMDAAGWTRTRAGPNTLDEVGVATTNLKLGIQGLSEASEDFTLFLGVSARR